MKPFNLEEAKAGKPVCTSDNKPVRLVCFDMHGAGNAMVGLVEIYPGEERAYVYGVDGRYDPSEEGTHYLDLRIAPVQHTVWVNLWRAADGALCHTPYLHTTEEAALNKQGVRPSTSTFIGTFPLTYEE